MVAKFLVGIGVTLLSVSCAAQVAPAAGSTHAPLATSAGVGLNYWSGDWGAGNINRWGPSVWATATVWHDLSVIAETHSMNTGGNQLASHFKYFTGGGGLVYTSDYWGRFQPSFKAEAGFASLTHPPNGTGRSHQSGIVYTFGVGVEYHTWRQMWTRVEYSYDFFPGFHSVISNQTHTLNPRGFTFGESFGLGR